MKMIFVGAALLSLAVSSFSEPSKEPTGAVRVLEATGKVESSLDGKLWLPVPRDAQLAEGTMLRTGRDSAADLLLQHNGSVFRLTRDSELRVGRLSKQDTGLGMVTETHLEVTRGSLVGSQRKLLRPSILEISTPVGKAFIRGTEYVVNSSGAVSVISGSVEVTYKLPGNKGSVKVTVNAGYTFNPATQTVAPTTPQFLQNVIADVNTVRNNAEVYRTAGATIVVKPGDVVSPTSPHGNNGVGNGVDPQPPGNPPINDGPGTGPGNPGNQGGPNR